MTTTSTTTTTATTTTPVTNTTTTTSATSTTSTTHMTVDANTMTPSQGGEQDDQLLTTMEIIPSARDHHQTKTLARLAQQHTTNDLRAFNPAIPGP